MNEDYIFPLVMIGVLIGSFIFVGWSLHSIGLERDEKDHFCQINGYDEALSYQIKEVNKLNYLGCYNAEVINGELVETEEWFVFYGVSEKK